MARPRNALLAIATMSLLGGCGKGGADYLLTGGNVITLDPALPRADTVVVTGDRITLVGAAADAERYRGDRTQVVALDGRTVVPGLIDSHVHLLAIGDYYRNQKAPQGNSFVCLTGTVSAETVAARVAAYAGGVPAGEWIIGKGWSQVGWRGGRFPNSADTLSRATPDHPVFLTRVDAHTAWVNRRALELADIRSETRDPAGGQILRDGRGRPTGILVDRAAELILPHIPVWTREERKERFRLALAELAAAGITTIHVAGFLARPSIVWTENGQTRENVEILQELARDAPLPVRVQVFLEAPSEAAEWYLRQGEPEPVGRLSIRGIKLFADGALGSWGASLEEAYADERSHHGLERLPPDELLRWMRLAKRARFQVAVHAIGDRAVRQSLDALAQVYGDAEDAHRHRPRLEHLSVTSPDDRRRLAESDFVGSVQPGFLVPVAPEVFMDFRRAGPSRETRLYAWKSMLEAGVRLSGSSDSYGSIETPLQGIYAACTRSNAQGFPAGGWHPEERLTREEALRLYTQGGAYAGFDEQSKGSLEKGKWADLVILSGDPLACPDGELLNIQVLGTMVGGRFSYRAPEFGR